MLCRLRPLLARERSTAGGVLPVRPCGEDCLSVMSDKGLEREYEFDRVFGWDDGQEQVREMQD